MLHQDKKRKKVRRRDLNLHGRKINLSDTHQSKNLFNFDSLIKIFIHFYRLSIMFEIQNKLSIIYDKY